MISANAVAALDYYKVNLNGDLTKLDDEGAYHLKDEIFKSYEMIYTIMSEGGDGLQLDPNIFRIVIENLCDILMKKVPSEANFNI